MDILKQKPEIKKTCDIRTKAAKLFFAQQKGLTDTEASKQIGVSRKNVSELERTKIYQACQKTFKDAIQEKITITELAGELLKNIKQDADKGAKNNAVKIALDKIEPDNQQPQQQQVNIVLRG